MSIIAPDSDVTLYAGVETSTIKRPVFSSVANQRSYFAGKVYRTKVGCTYCNGNAGDPLILEIPISEMYNFNYMSFKNKAFENKEIYARVMPPIYINNEVMAVPYVIDRFQTFMFDAEIEECCVERETLSNTEYNSYEVAHPFSNLDDTPYFYTREPLSFDIGVRCLNQWKNGSYDDPEYATQYRIDMGADGKSKYNIIDHAGFSGKNTAPVIIMCVSQTFETLQEGEIPHADDPEYNNQAKFPSCCKNYVFSVPDFKWLDPSTLQPMPGDYDLKKFLEAYTVNNAISSIVGLYYLPASFARMTRTTVLLNITPSATELASYSSKLLRFPYMYLRVTDFLGNKKEYKIEDFVGNRNVSKSAGTLTLAFNIDFTFNGYPQMTLTPVNYKVTDTAADEARNFDEKMIVTDFPQVGYNTDGYLTYLGSVLRGQVVKDATAAPWAYNPVLNTAGNIAQGLGNIFGNAKSGEAAMLVNGVGETAGMNNRAFNFGVNRSLHNAANEFKDKSYGEFSKTNAIPTGLQECAKAFANDEYHSGGSIASLPAYQFDRLGYTFELIRPHSSLMQAYTEYLTMYGYNRNQLKVPNIKNYLHGGDGPHFNNKNMAYLKTVGAVISGVDVETENEFEQIFNGGCWFVKGD